MPRVVPSQVVAFIDRMFPVKNDPMATGLNTLHRGHSGQLSGLVDLVDQIPGELLTMNDAAYASLICSKAHIREKLLVWAADQSRGHELGPVPGNPPQNPVTVIRETLAQCPDESPGPATSELNFIPDTDLRANLRNDIGGINRALSNGEWKAATVLAGSVVEALLLWALQRDPPAATSAARTLVGGLLRRQPPADLDSSVLHEYIEVAAHLATITPETATQTRLAKDFRNLIHPGRAQRLAQNCDRATALSAVAGVELVVRDLSP